jgi:hypothetical protein
MKERLRKALSEGSCHVWTYMDARPIATDGLGSEGPVTLTE